MPDVDIIAHLDAVERRIREDIAEVRLDVSKANVAAAGLEPRVKHLEGRARVMESIFGSAFLAMAGTFWAHLRGGR